MSNLSWLNVVAIVLVVVVFIMGAVQIVSDRNRAAKRKSYFQQAYGSSVDRMLTESGVDKDALRALRDTADNGVVEATRELIRAEPVPLKPAAEFIKRL